MDGAPELYAVVSENGRTTLKPLASSQVFADSHLESDIEEWVMNGLLEDKATLGELAVFAQQPTYVASRERRPDLLGIDADKNIAIIEFKRGEADEDILFQTLNYASWVTQQPYEVLNQLAQAFFSRQGASAAPESLKTYYYERFPLPPAEDGSEPPLPTDAEFLADFNRDPRIVIVATTISAEVLRIFDYLAQHGIRIDAHEFKFFESPQGERFIYRRAAHESPSGARLARQASANGGVQYASTEALAQYVRNDAIRDCIFTLPEWVDDEFEGNAVVDVRIPGPGNFRLRVLGQTARFGWYFAQQWIYAWDDEPHEDDAATLKAALSKPDEVKVHESSGHLRFHAATASDVAALKDQVRRHVARRQHALAAN
jgi:hypothetical protein